MPVTIYPSTLKIKDTNGTFHGADCIKGDTGPQGPHGSPIDVQVDGVSVVTNDVAHIDISGKADKVSNATAGNFAGLDAAGNLVDSGKGPDDITGAAPVITNSVSGAIVSFENGAEKPVESLVVGIEPVQDLHGYDSPWPAGGGKNLFHLNIQNGSNSYMSWTVSSDGVVTVIVNVAHPNNTIDVGTFDAKAGVTYIINGCPAGGSTGTQRLYFRYAPASEYDIGNGASFSRTEDTTLTMALGAGEVGTFIFKPMVRLASNTDATFAPYSNICPISGWTGAKVTRAGKNLFNGTVIGGYISANGTIAQEEHASFCHTGLIPVVGGKSYVWSGINGYA